ncbi:MAG: 6-carboxytetrahydropterin synthase QueD [Gammaproteobacteria bacterium]|nr:6-carboxytetrahydropterin synthase QueD [Gammaproteobacteria bacterium]
MTPRFTLKIVTDFAAAHTLRDYPGDCSRMHGHNWKVEVEVVANALNAVGMGMDFKAIKQGAKDVINALDHQYLNELTPFLRVNPTAENLALYLFQAVGERLNAPGVRVSAVTVWETERACARYSEDE